MDGTRDAIHARVDRGLDAHLAPTAWSAAEKPELAVRVLAAHGHRSGLAGQLTQRLPDGAVRSRPIDQR